ncbi:MAG TPA: hypothetical protein VFB90_04155 [Dehalococcoidia bacterium]|nr:hypothetical protein [Dehalococcoidia bacterium]
MEKSQTTGAVIMAGAVLQMVLFLMAIFRRSYLALALPVLGALTTVSALAFWIGWTMFTSEDEEEEEFEQTLNEA